MQEYLIVYRQALFQQYILELVFFQELVNLRGNAFIKHYVVNVYLVPVCKK